jgi:hypothetical protein
MPIVAFALVAKFEGIAIKRRSEFLEESPKSIYM